ncbi:MAG: hypothetical protein J7M15_03725 [Anaerolineae bacterium]|nr:hypothetical protein [Anaerolineae bacterium]
MAAQADALLGNWTRPARPEFPIQQKYASQAIATQVSAPTAAGKSHWQVRQEGSAHATA